MQVRQLIGPYAGQVVEMPYHVAESCVASGTACWLGDEHKVTVKGLKMADDEPAAEPSEAEAPAEPVRAHEDDGTFKADDPATPEVNEAWEGDEAPKQDAKPTTSRRGRRKK